METQPSIVEIQRLTAKHLKRYADMRKQALQKVPGFRLEEINEYLWIWQGIETKKFEWAKLSPAQRGEIEDAVEAGE